MKVGDWREAPLRELFVILFKKLRAGHVSVSSPVWDYFVIHLGNFDITLYSHEQISEVYGRSVDRVGYTLRLCENGKEVFDRYIPVGEYRELAKLFGACRELFESETLSVQRPDDSLVIERAVQSLV